MEIRGATARETADALVASLVTPAVREDPYPVYARLRELAPVHRTASGPVYLTGYEDCVTLTRAPAFRSQGPDWMDRVAPGWRDRPGSVATIESLMFRDPPDHTRLRRLVAGAFTARRLAGLRDDVTRLVDAALDVVADAGADGSPVNLDEVLAATLPISVIGRLVGVPREDWTALRGWMTAMMRLVELGVDAPARDAADDGAARLMEYFAGLVAERRARPGDDLASALATAGGADLSEAELLQTLTLLFMAGVDTMVNHLTNGTAALLAHPGQLAALRDDPALGPAAVEEALRYDAPVQIVARVTAIPIRLRDVDVPPGTLVIGLLGAANRDPVRFAAPDAFDLRRIGATVLSFGGGAHYCLGAPLARMEAAAFFPALLRRFPRLRLAAAPERRGTVFRGFADLPLAIR